MQDAGLKLKPRKLIVCVDGTLNQFSEKNTNVVELYSRIKKDPTQLTYYNSGVGTYARPFWWSFAYLKQQLTNRIDLAIAWNFEKVVLGAYRWLADTYQPGDQIFLFGFSRGAYQVRTLAAMIEKVGLIYPGNQEQIPFAWAIYSNDDPNTAKFKEAFCREQVDLHFVGVWDTVASVGVFPRKPFPLTDRCDYITHFRHALALDELRVKFLPELINDRAKPERTLEEVWFAGTHSDIGGGNKANSTLDRGGEPLKWMMEEAYAQGLSVRLHDVKIGVPHAEVTDSMQGFLYWVLEILPISWKRYRPDGEFDILRCSHWMEPREVLPRQSIHWTVGASLGEGSVNRLANPRKPYSPKAKVLDNEGKKVNWNNMKLNNHEQAHSTWVDNHDFTSMVNLLKEEPELADEGWFFRLHDYTLGDQLGQPEAIWAYGGPQFLQRLFKNYPTQPETTQIARAILGFDPRIAWNGPVKASRSGARGTDNDKDKELAERLQDMVLPRVSLLLTQWAMESPEPNPQPPKPGRWAWLLNPFEARASNTSEISSVDADWNLDQVPKQDRSIHLARAVVDIVTDVAKTKHTQVVEAASARLATLIAGVISELMFDIRRTASTAVWEVEKADLAEGLLVAVKTLFKYDGSKLPFYSECAGSRFSVFIRVKQVYPNLAVQAIRTVALLSQDYLCGDDIADSPIIRDLMAIMHGDDETADSSMRELLANEASTAVVALSENIPCGLVLSEDDSFNMLFDLLENGKYVDDILRVLKNLSASFSDRFLLDHIAILARLMSRNADVSLGLANIAQDDLRLGNFGMPSLNTYAHEGIVKQAIELLNHQQEAHVKAAARLLTNLIDREADLRESLEEPLVIRPELFQALTASCQVPSRSQLAIQELLGAAIRFTLQEPISDDEFAVLASLASAGDKQAMLAALCAAAHAEKHRESVSQYIPAIVETVAPENERSLKVSMEVLTLVVKKGLVLPDLCHKQLADGVISVIESAYEGTFYVAIGLYDIRNSTIIIALNLLEILCVDPMTRSYIVESGIFKTIILNLNNIGDHAEPTLDRLSQYVDLHAVFVLLRKQIKPRKLESKDRYQNDYGGESDWHADTDETSPLMGGN